MLAAVNPEFTICQKYPAGENDRSVNAPQTADKTINPMQLQIYLLYTLWYIMYSAETTIKFVRFFKTVDIGTPKSFKAQKEVTIMDTKMRFTGYHNFTIFQLKGSILINLNAAKSRTRTTHTKH